MKNPKKPTLRQKKTISKAGLTPDTWLVTLEDKDYLHLVERHFEGREARIINKKTLEVMQMKSHEPAKAIGVQKSVGIKHENPG